MGNILYSRFVYRNNVVNASDDREINKIINFYKQEMNYMYPPTPKKEVKLTFKEPPHSNLFENMDDTQNSFGDSDIILSDDSNNNMIFSTFKYQLSDT